MKNTVHNGTVHSSERPAENYHAYSGSDAYEDSNDASNESDTMLLSSVDEFFGQLNLRLGGVTPHTR